VSFKIGALANSFARLSESPNNTLLLQSTLQAAQEVVTKLNDSSALVTEMRNDANAQINSKVTGINTVLKDLYTINARIGNLTAGGQNTADLEDERDRLTRELAKAMDISSYKTDGNRVVILTKRGLPLVDESLHQLKFQQGAITPGSFYPGGGSSGVYVDNILIASNEISPAEIGGEFGALMELRDKTLPAYQAQLDEMAQKMAQRFDAIGLRLFTDANGNVPANTAPPAATGYTGFAGLVKINPLVAADPTLLRNGTYGDVYATGSNEMIRKVSEFAFGLNAYLRATGTANISAGTLYSSLGLTQINKVVGTVNLNSYVPDLNAAPNIAAPAAFTLTVGGVPYNINIAPGDTASTLVNTINTAVGSTVASLDGGGRLVLSSSGSIVLANNTIGAAGMADLGLTFGTYTPSNPSFTVQVGTQSPVTIPIAPGDTSTNILAALNAIPGLTASLGPGGVLQLQPIRGGSITLQNVTGDPLGALGMSITPVAHAPLRDTFMGPNADITSGVLGSNTIEGYARSYISTQAEEHSRAKETAQKEKTFSETLENRLNNESGVNIDQEIAELIRIQSAYTAAAKMITASEKMMDELMNSIR
jgi:flagellar hook-associated protein 1 FlgK